MIRSNPGHRRWLGTIVAAGIVAAVAMVSAASVSAASGSASHMSVDPIVSPAGAFDPAYGLFTCQVDNLSPATTCYDPFQMRTAYGVAPLIADGSDGKGKTIVIVDAFQSPNIVQQLNTYDSFYGLPSLNGLGGAPNPSLGTFTQVAPDGPYAVRGRRSRHDRVGRGDLPGRPLGARHRPGGQHRPRSRQERTGPGHCERRSVRRRSQHGRRDLAELRRERGVHRSGPYGRMPLDLRRGHDEGHDDLRLVRR